MSLAAAVITTFPDSSWDVYSKRMLESFVANWPAEVPIMVKLDTDKLSSEINKVLRSYDGLACGWEKEHAAFVERNKGKDDPENYRKQAVRFCHKVFAIKFALDAVNKAKAAGEDGLPRYLIWLDADVLTTRQVTPADIEKCLPKDGDAVSYMGRKDWPHSECGWLAFDLENGADLIVEEMYKQYVSDAIFLYDELHDSWVFDQIVPAFKATNLTPDANGMEVWPQSPMASWSKHYKGPIAKAELANLPVVQQKKQGGMQSLKIQTKNSMPNDDICRNIIENQAQIKNWILPCEINDEEVVVVSAGPMFIPEDLHAEIEAGRRIVAVKHVLKPLEEAGIKPWACILLDPREHMNEFVTNPDKDILWFVASQVNPSAVRRLLDAGCTVWGYHASVGAGEAKYTANQPASIVDGGSATATRGLFVLDKLGFRKFRLYGYDLCFAKKPDLTLKDEYGQPKYFEIEVGYQLSHYKDFRWFWSQGELLAQADEFRQIMEMKKWNIQAFGQGIVPFLCTINRVNNLRQKRKLGTMPLMEPVHYEEFLGCKKATLLSTLWRKMPLKIRRNRMKAVSY